MDLTPGISTQPVSASLFIVTISCLSIVVGWLIKKKVLPLTTTINYSEWQFQFIQIWKNLALLMGVVIPLIGLIFLFEKINVRQFLIIYLLLIIVQIISERIFSSLFCKSMTVIIGTIYTLFRLWQLWEGLHLIAYSQPWLSLLWSVLFFWIANLIMLLILPWPIIIQRRIQEIKN